MDGDDDNALVLVENHIDQQEPAPWAEQEPEAGPTSAKLGAHLRELGKRAQGVADALLRVRRQAVRVDESLEIFRGDTAQLDAGHRLELVELQCLARSRLIEA